MKRLITDDTVTTEFKAGRRRIAASSKDAVVTSAAWSKARELGVVIDDGSAPRSATPSGKTSPPKTTTPAPADAGRATKVVDASGVLVVRGNSVQLGNFTGAGPGKHIGLLDLVTSADGSPMTAGIMSFSAADSFAWSLGYDEIDLVLEGVLQIQIDGRTVEGRAGDVLYIPKGSTIVFATPHRTKVFYVTHPADWAATGNAARPQK
jgi:ethanolamine utilization protein EutQ